MANQHNLIAGLLPEDGNVIIDQLNEASKEGWIISHTTCCAISEDASYYIATLVRPIADPPRRGIGMGEHTRNREAPDVGTITGEKQTRPEGS